MSDPPLDPATLDMLRQLTVPGEPDVLREVLTLYRAEMPKRLTALLEAAEAGDLHRVERMAHSIRGGAGNIGARALQQACRTVEDAARQQDLAAARAGMGAVQTEAGRVDAAIEPLLA